MKARLGLRLLAAAWLACAPLAAHAVALSWNEALNGDLSNDGLSPTSLSVDVGHNTLLGTTGNPGTGIDRDYFTFTVAPGTTLNSITLLGSTTISGGASFFAVQAGPQLTVTPAGFGVENLIGFAHYTNDDVGTNLLPLIAPSLSAGLPAGTYSFWVQETGGPVSYGLEFNITSPVPLPGALLLLLSGLFGLGTMRRLGTRAT